MAGTDARGTRGTQGTPKESVEQAARQAADSPWLVRLARVGLAARGLVYLLVALLAVQIVSGGGGTSADQKGAFQTLAGNGLGKAMLWLVVVGFLGYAAWQASEAAFGHQREPAGRKRTAKRVESAAKAVIYLGLAVAAFRVVTGGSGGGQGGESATARLLGVSGGRLLVGLAGAVIVVVAAAMAWRGLQTEFEEQLEVGRMSPPVRSAVVRLGQVGYVARGVVLAIVGVLVVAAAVTFDPAKARGLDLALRELAGRPYGTALLLLVALGLACFGAYSLAEARYRRL